MKFRAFDHAKKTFPFVGFHIIGEVTAFDLLKQYSIESFNDLDVTEWTGCQDKNGKDIYEGDFISYKGMKGVVEFCAGMFIVSWPDQTDNELAYMGIADMEVVGNRFEL